MPGRRNESGVFLSVSVLSQLLRYLAHVKIDAKTVLRSAGVDPDVFEHPDIPMRLEDYISIEDEAVRLSGDPYFGLHMGEYFEAGDWSILGYMMMSCRTLGEASEKAARYQNIIGSVIHARGYLGFGKVTVVMATPPHAPKLSRHCYEAALSSYIRMMRSLSGRNLSPLEVGFDHESPPSDAEYTRVFRCPVYFARKRTYIVFDIRHGKVPVLAPNAVLLAHFETYARELSSEIEGNDATTREVIRRILSRMDSRTLSIRGVAREMGMSVRTLQNRLKGEGRVFSDILEEIRERVAKKHLRENSTVEDITCLLGFSAPSAFRKAFKKWTGVTPREYRELSLAGGER